MKSSRYGYQLEHVRLFLAVAEAGSVSGAAAALGTAHRDAAAGAARARAGREALPAQRRGRGAHCRGERLPDPARRMAEWAGEVGRAAASTDRAVTGLVRFTAPPFIAFDFLAPFAAFLGERHRGLRLEPISSMEYLDLPRGEADLALRVQPPPREQAGGERGQRAESSELALLETFHFENAVFVSRALRARLPRGPLRLDALPWIAWAAPWEDLPPNPQLRAQRPGFVPAFTSDHFLVNLAAARRAWARWCCRGSRTACSAPLRWCPSRWTSANSSAARSTSSARSRRWMSPGCGWWRTWSPQSCAGQRRPARRRRLLQRSQSPGNQFIAADAGYASMSCAR